MSSDAVWVVGNDRLFAAKGDRLVRDVLRLAIFMLMNGATDLGIDLLLRAVKSEGISFDSYRDDPITRVLLGPTGTRVRGRERVRCRRAGTTFRVKEYPFDAL